MSVSLENKQKSEKAKEQGNSFIKNKDYKSALECYNQALKFNPFEAALYYNRALVYSKENMHEKVVEDCNKALELNNEYIKVYERRAQAYFALKDFCRAADDLISLLEVEPDKRDSRELLKKCYEHLGEQKKIQNTDFVTKGCEVIEEDLSDTIDDDLILYDSLETIEKTENLSKKCFEQCKLWIDEGKYHETIQGCHKGLSVWTEITGKKVNKIENMKFGFMRLAAKSHIYLLEYENALEVVSQGLRLNFTNESLVWKLIKYKTFVLQLKGEYTKALNEILSHEFSNHKKPEIEETVKKLKFLINPQDSNKSIEKKKLEKALAKWTKQKEAAIQEFKKNRFEEAIDEFESIIWEILKKFGECSILNEKALKDLLVTLYNNKAIGLARLKRFHESSRECFKSLLFDFENLKPLFRIGKNLSELGYRPQARSCFKVLSEKEKSNSLFAGELEKVEAEMREKNELIEDKKIVGQLKMKNELIEDKKRLIEGEHKVDCKEKNLDGQEKVMKQEINGSEQGKSKDKSEEKVKIVQSVDGNVLKEQKNEENSLNLTEVKKIIVNEEKKREESFISSKVKKIDVSEEREDIREEHFISSIVKKIVVSEEKEDIREEKLKEKINFIEHKKIDQKPSTMEEIKSIEKIEIPLNENTTKTNKQAFPTETFEDNSKLIATPSTLRSKALINSAISIASSYEQSHPLPKSHIEFISSCNSYKTNKTPLIPFLKSIPPESYEAFLVNKELTADLLEFFVSELAVYKKTEEPWAISLLSSISKVSFFEIVKKMLNSNTKATLNDMLSRLN